MRVLNLRLWDSQSQSCPSLQGLLVVTTGRADAWKMRTEEGDTRKVRIPHTKEVPAIDVMVACYDRNSEIMVKHMIDYAADQHI